MSWSIERADCEGDWPFGTCRQWSEEDWGSKINPKLDEWSRLRWSEIDRFVTGSGHKSHHNMAIDALRDEAQQRLLEIDQVSELIFRFRLGNLPRLWGYREVGHFYVLWYDPHHEIYLTDPSS